MKRIISLSLLFAALAVNSSEAMMSRLGQRLLTSTATLRQATKTTYNKYCNPLEFDIFMKPSILLLHGMVIGAGVKLAAGAYELGTIVHTPNFIKNSSLSELEKERLLRQRRIESAQTANKIYDTGNNIAIASGALAALYAGIMIAKKPTSFLTGTAVAYGLFNAYKAEQKSKAQEMELNTKSTPITPTSRITPASTGGSSGMTLAFA